MSDYCKKRVTAIEVEPGKSVSDLLADMSKTGFQGKSLARVVDVFESMINDLDTTIFFGYAGSLSTTGQWKIVNWLIENRIIDVLIPPGQISPRTLLRQWDMSIGRAATGRMILSCSRLDLTGITMCMVGKLITLK